MFSYLKQFRRASTLDAVVAPSTRVKLVGRVVGEEVGEGAEDSLIQSPMTDRRGVAVFYGFWDLKIVESQQRQARRYFTQLYRGHWGDALTLDVAGTLLSIPLGPQVSVAFRSDYDPAPVVGRVPDALRDAAGASLDRAREELCYDERVILVDDVFELCATLSPPVIQADGPYRGAETDGAQSFQLRSDLERVRLVER